MKLKAMVVGDELKAWALNGQNGETRTLTVIEALDIREGRLNPQVYIKIPIKGTFSGDAKEGANLTGMNVELTLTDVKQNNETKRVEFRGDVARVVSTVQEVQFDGGTPPAQTKAPVGTK